MKILPLATLAALFLAASGLAKDLTPPFVAKPLPDVTVSVGETAPTVIKVKNVFALKGVTEEVVRFTTTLGNIDVELYASETPNTVANFLSYVNKGYATNGGYDNTLIERAIPGFILQGGGFYLDNTTIDHIAVDPTIASEAGISNTKGTIAMALSNGPNSAISDWFFNVADNVSGAKVDLDNTSHGGPFTVFGRVIEDGMKTINTILALQTVDISSYLGGTIGPSFMSLPLLVYANGANPQNLVYTNSIAAIPLTATAGGGAALLKLKVTSSDPTLVQPQLSGHRLTLTYPGTGTGTARITLQARDSAKTKATTSFTVTVQ